MGKKKYTKETASDIIDEIMNDVITEMDLPHVGQLKDKLPMLCSNNRAIRCTGTLYISTEIISIDFFVLCQMILKHNPKMKKYKREMLDFEFGGSENCHANSDRQLVELAQSGLTIGDYFAKLNKNNYLYLQITNANDNSEDDYAYEAYFIGKKCAKFHQKFTSAVLAYKNMKKKDKREMICNITTRSAGQFAIFKPFDQVILRDKKKILNYIDNWKKNIPTYYDDYRMISKLSILLYGKPGTGKSTFAKAVANYLGIDNITVVPPEYFSTDIENAGKYRGMSIFNRTVFAIDDIDCVCKARDADSTNDNNAAMSKLLQFLDNPPTFYFRADNGLNYPISIVIATTNYIDRLDEAVKRFGRFDLKIEMEDFDKKEAQEMCDIYHLDLEKIMPDCKTKGWTVSPAYLQAKCLENVDRSLKGDIAP